MVEKKTSKCTRIELSNEELDLILDGFEDTLTRLKQGQIKESYNKYTKRVLILKDKIERIFARR